MKIQRLWEVFFSPTGGTRRVTTLLGERIGERLGLSPEELPFTLPAQRERELTFAPGDLVIVGCPTYAGRLPNKIMPDMRRQLRGNGALAVAAVTFGNRNCDNSLAELCALLEESGFHTVAAGAFVARHAFTDQLAYGRPGWSDQQEIRDFSDKIAVKVNSLTDISASVIVPGDPQAPYYIPRGEDGQPVNFLKAKPQTDLARCSRCGACARQCPMGAIDPRDVASVPGTCIKCQACVRKCTRGAKFFSDPAFLSHVAMLEREYQETKGNQIFLCV